MTTTESNYDDDLEPEQKRWLKLHGYPTLEDWARDSDYIEGNAGEWYYADDAGDPFAGAVDLVGCMLGAIEAQTCDYEVTISNVFPATDQADAVEQMIEWLTADGGAQHGGYRWTRLDDPPITHNGQILESETGFLDADDLPECAEPVSRIEAPR